MDKKEIFICSRCSKEFTEDEMPFTFGYAPGRHILCKKCDRELIKLLIRQRQELKTFLDAKQEIKR